MTRTALLEPGVRQGLEEVFGTAAGAWRGLRLRGIVPYVRFYRVWKGIPMTPQVVKAIEAGWREFVARVASKTKAPEGA